MKLLARLFLHGGWLPRDLNWWIGVLFAIGAVLFCGASILCLLDVATASASVIYFLGSIPFTIAAYLQLHQAANAAPLPSAPKAVSTQHSYFGWRPHDVGWLSCATQFVGTVLFNFNTLDAMIPSLSWFGQDLLVWTPNFIGSILFLISGYLAFIEVGHAYWAWAPKDLSWWITFINLLGCAGFMISAVLAITLPGQPDPVRTTVSVAFTLQGAISFLLGALLMLPEASQAVA
ncbi:hypothetical protein Pan97_26320 [Bremerella volcania]|uniref:YrhK domain-containing protein n=1 Tax=Bremerella volcania TaxID=2527984 RepID=A0A518C8N8_9BACT|nr:hypothetical protein Pan97_26320 [Bremerella volcania]